MTKRNKKIKVKKNWLYRQIILSQFIICKFFFFSLSQQSAATTTTFSFFVFVNTTNNAMEQEKLHHNSVIEIYQIIVISVEHFVIGLYANSFEMKRNK